VYKIEDWGFIMSEQFSFCVGHPWSDEYPHEDDTNISVYAFGTQVHHGTMKDALRIREYVNKRTGKNNYIYKLVQVSESS